MVRYYYAGGERVAEREATSSGETLYYLLGDHLGSTAITADSSGNKVAELRYKAWGESRYTYGTTPTKRQYTGQVSEMATIGLYFYGARFYDPALSRFTSADSIIPGAGDVQAWDRYAFVNNNPLRYNNPTGHTSACAYNSSDPECSGDTPIKHQTFDDRYGITFTGSGWTVTAKAQVRQAVFDVGMAFAREHSGVTFAQAFTQEYSLGITFEWNTQDSRMRNAEQNANPACKGNFTGDCAGGGGFTESSSHILFASLSSGIYGVKNVVHELGHAYRRGEPATNMPGWIPNQRDRILRPNDGRLNWQQNKTKSPSETFADMFIAWVYRAWNVIPGNSDLVSEAQKWMNEQMP